MSSMETDIELPSDVPSDDESLPDLEAELPSDVARCDCDLPSDVDSEGFQKKPCTCKRKCHEKVNTDLREKIRLMSFADRSAVQFDAVRTNLQQTPPGSKTH